MGIRLGANCKLWIDPPDFGDAGWNDTLVKIVRDLNADFSHEEADASSRVSRVKMVEPAMRMNELSFEILEDPTNASYATLHAAFAGRSNKSVVIATAGDDNGPSNGEIVCTFEGKVTQFSGPTTLNGASVRNVAIKPCYPAAALPQLFAFGSGTVGFNTSVGAWQTSGSDETITIKVYRTGGTQNQNTIDFTFNEGSATDPEDYHGVDGTLTFNTGIGEQEITFVAKDAATPSSVFTLVLSNSSQDALGTATLTFTLND